MSDVPWEKLPEATTEMCSYPIVASKPDGETIKEALLRELGTPCGDKALWIKRDTCGCGAVHMVVRHCGPHQEVYLSEQKRTAEWGRKNVETIEGLPPGIVGFRRKARK